MRKTTKIQVSLTFLRKLSLFNKNDGYWIIPQRRYKRPIIKFTRGKEVRPEPELAYCSGVLGYPT